MNPPEPSPDRPRLLLVGGGGGLVGRSVLPEFVPDFRIRSLHRSLVAAEQPLGVEWVPTDIARERDWRKLLEGVDVVLTLAWHRWGSESLFRELYGGLSRLLSAAREVGVPRFLHVSVPAAPDALERGLPYLFYKRRFDLELAASGLSYRIVRPTMMFGDRDVLLTVMLREIGRYPFFPLFGDGEYHLSPIAVQDVARILRLEVDRTERGTIDLGGPERFPYRSLTDLLFSVLGKKARYWRLSPRASLQLASLLQSLGSTLLYAYEVEWLLSDMLGLPPTTALDRPLARVEPFLAAQVARARSSPGVPG